jgi:hypothetical protein
LSGPLCAIEQDGIQLKRVTEIEGFVFFGRKRCDPRGSGVIERYYVSVANYGS